MNDPIQVLILGGFSAGKTHYGAQLLSRLYHRRGELQLRQAAPNLSLFEAALTKLSEGMTSEHTSRDLYETLVIPTRNSAGDQIDLVWPEYGGEQFDDIAKKRLIPPAWATRVLESNHWILVIRLMSIKSEYDFISRPLDILSMSSSTQASQESQKSSVAWFTQSSLIELMQVLLFVKGQSIVRRISEPKLLVLLSCWDELDVQIGERPRDILATYLPLFCRFLDVNWIPESLLTYGLSSLSKKLSSEVPDEEYKNKGPESFGYVVLPDGSQSSDLTLPIASILGR